MYLGPISFIKSGLRQAQLTLELRTDEDKRITAFDCIYVPSKGEEPLYSVLGTEADKPVEEQVLPLRTEIEWGRATQEVQDAIDEFDLIYGIM